VAKLSKAIPAAQMWFAHKGTEATAAGSGHSASGAVVGGSVGGAVVVGGSVAWLGRSSVTVLVNTWLPPPPPLDQPTTKRTSPTPLRSFATILNCWVQALEWTVLNPVPAYQLQPPDGTVDETIVGPNNEILAASLPAAVLMLATTPLALGAKEMVTSHHPASVATLCATTLLDVSAKNPPICRKDPDRRRRVTPRALFVSVGAVRGNRKLDQYRNSQTDTCGEYKKLPNTYCGGVYMAC
jgi:hypothetical protein